MRFRLAVEVPVTDLEMGFESEAEAEKSEDGGGGGILESPLRSQETKFGVWSVAVKNCSVSGGN